MRSKNQSTELMQLGFGGHESFPLRHGWLKKGFDVVRGNAVALSTDEAMTQLGVGKNMLSAIRHWGLACAVFKDAENGRGIEPSTFGMALLAENGWDPFLEDVGSIWLLHWKLTWAKEIAAAWNWVFKRPRGNRFSKDLVVLELQEQARISRGRVSPDTIKRDVDVFVRSYVRKAAKHNHTSDEALESPFTALGLVRPAANDAEFELVQGVHPSLPLAIFQAALWEYAKRDDTLHRSISLDELMYGPNSPGRVFRLSEEGLILRLHQLQMLRPDSYAVDETAGLRQLLLKGDPIDENQILNDYYKLTSRAVSK